MKILYIFLLLNSLLFSNEILFGKLNSNSIIRSSPDFSNNIVDGSNKDTLVLYKKYNDFWCQLTNNNFIACKLIEQQEYFNKKIIVINDNINIRNSELLNDDTIINKAKLNDIFTIKGENNDWFLTENNLLISKLVANIYPTIDNNIIIEDKNIEFNKEKTIIKKEDIKETKEELKIEISLEDKMKIILKENNKNFLKELENSLNEI